MLEVVRRGHISVEDKQDKHRDYTPFLWEPLSYRATPLVLVLFSSQISGQWEISTQEALD
jgi:hypothetical protein